MHYVVIARFKIETAVNFYKNLTNGTIYSQRPDGKEIVASMKRAKSCQDGIVRWSEVCYCSTPLQHERETVYDHFFKEIKIEEVEDYVEFEGEDFMEFLAKLYAVRE